jgi:NitT/TauT family transport system ATP-binding protein
VTAQSKAIPPGGTTSRGSAGSVVLDDEAERGATGIAPEPAVSVAVRDLYKTYRTEAGPIDALAGITLDIRKGEFLTVLGPSGCGKSTLLKCIAGLEQISRGSITVDGETVKGPPPDLGIVFQRDLLLDWRNILDNILINVEFLGLRRADYVDRARHLLALFGLDGYERRFPWELSGGMRQRVAICRALIDDPGFLLMDEPFGALDAMTRDELNLELQRIWVADKKTVLFITHSIPEAVFLSDRVIVLDRNPGRIAAEFIVDLPRPRRLSDRDKPAFGKYSAEIRATITSMGAMRDE